MKVFNCILPHSTSGDKATANTPLYHSKKEVLMHGVVAKLISSIMFITLILGLFLVLLPKEVAAQGGTNDPISEIPFPRVYWITHDTACSALSEEAKMASILEVHADCTGNLTERADIMTNQWETEWNPLNIAFVPGWYWVGYDTDGGGYNYGDIRKTAADKIEDCGNWRFPRNESSRINWVKWKDSKYPFFAANLGTDATNNNTITCNGELYVDWWPNWITTTAVTDTKWDGIRIDMSANIHSYYSGDVDHDGNGLVDNTEGEGCGGKECAAGRKHLNELYRSGINHMFEGVQNSSNLLTVGNDAWFPASGISETFESPGFSTGPVNLVMAEDWTKHWHEENAVLRYQSWPDPVEKDWRAVDFSTATKIWKQFDDADKHYVIMSKQISAWWDADQEENIKKDEGVVWEDVEKRFSLAAATMYGAVHSYARETVWSEWVDEYAVYPGNKIATTDANRELGMGWLGKPRSDMMTVDSDGAPSETISTAVNSVNWTTIKDKVWVRYFDHGVVLLNPTDSPKDVKLLGSFKKLMKDGDSVNDTDLGADPSVSVPKRDGLFLYDACRAMDFNDDGLVDIDDINIVLNASIFNQPFPGDLTYDLDGDGIVDISDIFTVSIRFGEICLP